MRILVRHPILLTCWIISSPTKALVQVSSNNVKSHASCEWGLEGSNIYVNAGAGTDIASSGFSPLEPYQTIDYAVRQAGPCQTIHVMTGIYQNKNFGTGNENNDAVVNMEGVSDLIIKNYMSDKPVIEFDGKGGFIGGSISNPVINVEISGIEISGPNGSILWEHAMANRLAENKSYYGGRGIAIWKGNNINIHNMIVHHCPASAIRVNRGDYVTIHNNTVYSNTWWSRSVSVKCKACYLLHSLGFLSYVWKICHLAFQSLLNENNNVCIR